MLPDEYLDKITSAHISRPRYMAWLKALLELVCDAGTCTEAMDEAFYIETASGAQLDVIGNIVGISRKLPFTSQYVGDGIMADPEYRNAIKAKILFNQWDGTNGGLPLLWQAIYPSLQMTFHDNQNMSMNIEVRGSVSNELSEMIQAGMIVPVPAGVSVTYTIYNSEIPAVEVGTDTGLYEFGNDAFPNQGST